MKYPVSSSLRHKGKVIELDAAREMVVLLGVNGDVIGSLSWDFVIDQILAYRKVSVPKRNPIRASHFACVPGALQQPRGAAIRKSSRWYRRRRVIYRKPDPSSCRDQTGYGVLASGEIRGMDAGKRNRSLGLSESRPIYVQSRNGGTVHGDSGGCPRSNP